MQTLSIAREENNKLFIEPLPHDGLIYGSTQAMQWFRRRLEVAAAESTPVLIRGEAGSGKEIFVRLLHQRSPYAKGPLVKVRCAAIPSSLMERELFGYEHGASGGGKAGRLEEARNGTLFLDDVGELTLPVQIKLLHAIEEQRYFRVGGESEQSFEARIVCASCRDLEECVKRGVFRRDLYDRLNSLRLTAPPLRERREDIPLLAEYFRTQYNRAYHREAPSLPETMLHRLRDYSWPGNMRELENVIRRYVIFGQAEAALEELIQEPHAIPLPEIPRPGSLPLKKLTRQVTRELERRLILQVLEENQWSRKKAASILKISYRALLYKIRASGIPSLNRGAGTRVVLTMPQESSSPKNGKE